MHRHFDDEIKEVKTQLARMGEAAEWMIEGAIRSLVDRDTSNHEEIFKREEEVNTHQIEIDDHTVTLLALQHPVATDLRFLIMVSKIAGELERIADLAVNICQNTGFLLKEPPLKPLVDIPIMAEKARKMLREGLDAFVRADADLAQEVLDADDEVDALKDQIFRELLTYMMADPKAIQRALALILISRNLERVGDHATNIAEEVIYLAKGRDVRHHHEELKRKEGNEK